MKIFELDLPEDSQENIRVRELTPICNDGFEVKVFTLDPASIIRVIDFDASGDDEEGFIKLFIPGPPGPPGPAGISRPTKAGTIAAVGFTGSPRKSTVTFTTPFVDSTYALALTGEDGRTFTYESKTPSGFTINSNANAALTGEVSWIAMSAGET